MNKIAVWFLLCMAAAIGGHYAGAELRAHQNIQHVIVYPTGYFSGGCYENQFAKPPFTVCAD